jgi:beta-fructofuranosidase
MVATSSDPLLLNWDKDGDGAVIPMTPDSDTPYYVYDPNIWNKDGVYLGIRWNYGGLTENQIVPV